MGHPVSARVHRIILEGKQLWAATSHGLAQSADGGDTWTTVSAGSGLSAEETFDLAASESGLWAATSEGLFLSADHGATWRHEGNIACPVRILARDGRQLWMATGGGLICRTRGGDWKTFSVRSNVLCHRRDDGFRSRNLVGRHHRRPGPLARRRQDLARR